MASRNAGMSARRAAVTRKTLETAIEVELASTAPARGRSQPASASSITCWARSPSTPAST